MYATVAFLTNLWMRLFPNYKEYFFYSKYAQHFDEKAEALLIDFQTRASTCSRDHKLLEWQKTRVESLLCVAECFDEMARRCMQPITIEDLKNKHESKFQRSAYNVCTGD